MAFAAKIKGGATKLAQNVSESYQWRKEAMHEANGSVATRGGAYSLVVSTVVILLVIAVNVLVGLIPSTYTKFDMSSTNLYSITSNTKVVVNALEKDVTVYWIVQSGEEDDVIENLLERYDALSAHIEIVKKNPDVYPTFAAQYTDETVSNNSLVVECGTKSRYIAYSDIYQTSVDYSTYTYVYSFDGEGLLTSAIDYVVSEDLPKIYVLEGHGEDSLSSIFSEAIAKENIELDSVSLVKTGTVPEDADCLLIYAPESDIAETEKDILADYIADGGKLLVFAGPLEEGELTNLYALMETYGVSAAEGIVVEGNSNYYAYPQPYILMPEVASSDITAPLLESNYYILMPIATGLTVSSTSAGTVTTLLETSDEAFSKIAGYALNTYAKEEGDIDGGFAVAVQITDTSGGEIVWFASSYMLNETYNSYSSGGNLNLAMNAVSELVGETDAISIRSKSLGYNYLTITDSAATMLKVFMLGVIPLIFLGSGIYMVISRRRMRNE